MKKYINISAILLILLSTSAHASNNIQVADRLVLDLAVDDDSNINPDLFIPIPWSQNWFSGLGYRNSSFQEQSTLNGFSESKLSTAIKEQVVRVNIISYQVNNGNFSYSIGGDYGQTSIDKVEFGYFHLDNGVIDDFVAFDNNIEIEVTGLSLRGDLTYGKSADNNSIRLTAIVSPGNTLDVKQSTDIKPIVPVTGQGSSSKSQDLGYNLHLATNHKLGSFLSVGLDLQYNVLPLNYDVKVLASTADSFIDSTVDTTQTTTRVGLRFIFNYPITGNLYPVLGITSEDVKTKDNLSGGESSFSQTLTTVGLTARF